MSNTTIVSISSDFSPYPAGRFREDGDASGLAFREDILLPALNDSAVDILVVSFDGVAGFGSSFLEEAFGGLVRTNNFRYSDLVERLKLTTSENELEDYVNLSWSFIRDAEQNT